MQIIKKIQMENISSMTINPKAVIDFNEHRELYLKRTAWAGACSSWFKPGPDGQLIYTSRRSCAVLTFVPMFSEPRDVPRKPSLVH